MAVFGVCAGPFFGATMLVLGAPVILVRDSWPLAGGVTVAPFFAASPAVALLFFLSPGAFGLHHLSFPILLLFWERCRLGGTPGGGVALPSLRFRAVMSAPEALLDRPY